MPTKLIISVFPGVDLLGLAFERSGFCVVQSQDKLTGGDIINFKPPPGVFAGLIGGSPCQDFSALNRNPGGHSLDMQKEYVRVVNEASPEWFLYENVARAPSFKIAGYTQQRFALNLSWFSDFGRLRHFIFGSKSGRLLDPMIKTNTETKGGAVVGCDSRSFRACCDIQGLPGDFDLPGFTATAKKQAVANGVPLPMGDYVAGLILTHIYGNEPTAPGTITHNKCRCGCGRSVVGRAKTAGATCRKRLSRMRRP